MSRKVIGGIEGGGTRSNVTLIDVETSKVIATIHKEESTNFYQIGMEETCRRLQALVTDALKAAGLDTSGLTLEGLGLSLSGCEVEEQVVALKKTMVETFPQLSKRYAVASDTIGSLYTASDRGGVVLIAGTGSNALLSNPGSKKTERCGGWGHMLGDEGSAYYVAQTAVKMVFDYEDNLVEGNGDEIAAIKGAMLEHFGIKDKSEMLSFYYGQFSKPKIAGFCAVLATLANKSGGCNSTVKKIFENNGRWLAKHLLALEPKMSKELLSPMEGGLPVVCVGSVWKSWKLLQPGFVAALRETKGKHSLRELNLLNLVVPMSVGACYMAAEEANLDIKKSYAENVCVFCRETI